MSDETTKRKRRPRSSTSGANMRAAANGEPQWSGRNGAPSKYRPQFDEQAKRLCLLGFTNQQLAYVFKVNIQTINDWEDHIESFSQALLEGREGADAHVAASLFHRAIGYSHKSEHIAVVSDGGANGSHVERPLRRVAE